MTNANLAIRFFKIPVILASAALMASPSSAMFSHRMMQSESNQKHSPVLINRARRAPVSEADRDTGACRIQWRSKITGYSGRGHWIFNDEQAAKWVRFENQMWPQIEHWYECIE